VLSSSLLDRLRVRDPGAIARVLSTVIDEAPGAEEVLAGLTGRQGRAYLIGVTGPPGAGKSTLVDQMIKAFRADGRTVGVLAVDPTSPLSGGAVLGDRVRMQTHSSDEGVFIRSMATRGHLGGLARTTRAAAVVLDAAGFDVVIIETVGVGQAEVDVASLADVSVVVLVPGTGDEVQALKAGLLEVADIFVINKADREGADRMAAAIDGTLSLDTKPEGGWRPPVLKTVATEGGGVQELVDVIARFRRERSADIAIRQGRRAIHLSAVVDHIGIAVADPQSILAFLTETFGARPGDPKDVPGDGVRVQFVPAGGTKLEIIEPGSGAGQSAVAKFLERRGPGLHHLAFRVADLPGTLSALKARGVRLIDETPRAGAGGTSIAFVHPSSTGGILVELVQGGTDARAGR